MPFYKNPSAKAAQVLIVYRNFKACQGNPRCHIGLGVSALHTVRVLRRAGVSVDVLGVWTADHVRKALCELPNISHCVIEAPWIETAEIEKLLAEFPNVHFVVRAHSAIGFLQVEAGAIRILRELLALQDTTLNLTVSANSEKLTAFLQATYSARCLYLPNLYDAQRSQRKAPRAHDHRVLRISSFGAIRLLKGHTSAAAAAMLIAKERGCDLEFWISVNREDGGHGIIDSLRNMFSGLCWAKLVEQPWQDWGHFRKTVGHMDLALQLSATETFNLVTADAVAEGVPCVVTPAIEWVPRHWQIDGDAIEDVARVGGYLLSSPKAADEGLCALTRFVATGTDRWLAWLDGKGFPPNPC